MQKKYSSKIDKSTSSQTARCSKKKGNNSLSTWLILLIVLFGVSNSNLFGQVTITKPNLTINTCTFPSVYMVLPQIEIQENANANIANQGNGRIITLTAPANFEFNPGVGMITDRSRDVNNSTINVTATTITITYNCNTTTQIDRWRINNLEIRAINNASTGNITRTGGNGTVSGLVNGTTLTNTITSNYTAPVSNAGGAATVCVGSTTPAFTNATVGGIWSIINGSGSATISAGGVVTGVTAGNATIVYTVGSCSSNSSLIINPTPASISGGASTVCVGENTPAFTNTTVGGIWSITNGSGSATISSTGVVTGVTSGTAFVLYTVGTCGKSKTITINSVPATVTTPTPINGATSVCYAGGGTVTSISWGVVANATSYDVYFGIGSVPVTISANVTTNTYNTGALIANSTYYWRVIAKNACGDAITSATYSFTTAAIPCYCTPSISATYQTSTSHHIRKVEFIGTLQDIVNTSSFPTTVPYGYENYTGLAVKSIQAKGEGVNIYMESPSSGYIKAWVDWNSDGDFADIGEIVYDAGGTSQASTTFGFIIPTGIAIGDYRVRLRISGRNNSFFGTDAGFAWNSCSTNLAYYGETEDYILRVIDNCGSRISTITNGSVCGSGSVTLNVTGTVGATEFRWYSAQTGGTLLASTPTGTWNTPSISTSTPYWVTAFDGSCETLVRSKINAIVKPLPTLSFATSNTEVCGENSIVALTASGDNEIIYLINEKFEGGMGTFSNVHYVSNATKNTETAWQIKTSAFVPSGSGATWFPAIQSNFGANNFAFVTSDIGTCGSSCYYTVDNGLVSNTFNSSGFLNLTFKFRAYFDRYYPNGFNPTNELMTVDISTNGGGTWNSISGNVTSDIGYGTRFTDYSYDLTAYINQTNLKVRIRYYTNTWANGAAIDDIELYGSKPLSTALNWSGTPLPDVYTDAATTIPYISGTPATTVYVKPVLSQLETDSYTFTATASLTNGCAVSQDITILNKSSIWKGTIDSDWNNPNNWSPAVVPTANSCVIIPNTAITSNIIGTNYDGFGKSLIIMNGGKLNIQPNNTLTITDGISVEATGTFNLENAASLIQVNNVANTGNISMKRNVNVRKLDYVYWSSPVADFALNKISTTNYRFKWLPTIATNTNGWGNWANANENMVNGKGYIVRGPNSYTTTPQNYTQNFIGVPNNGIINMPISRGTYDGVNYVTGVSGTLATRNDDNWNLIGNPYPSAISANAFLATNTNIAGFIKFWTHGNLPSSLTSDPFYSDFVQNYTVSDYVTYNATGANPPVGNGNIAAGQGFFVLMNHSSSSTNENVVFNNTMRRNDYRNDLFFRNGNVTNSNNEEKHRIWLNLISPTSKSSSSLIGYLTDATDELDRMFDAPALDIKTNFELYSFSNNDKLTIQGKALPFSNDHKVLLGISISEAGTHTIGISKVDGLFEYENQNIYLEDLTLGTIHNLRTSPYSFTATTGRFEDRFILKFNNVTLGNENFTADSIVVFTDDSININASNKIIKSVKIHDLLGRIIGTFNNVNSNTFTSSKISKTRSTLLIEVTLDNGYSETCKVIF